MQLLPHQQDAIHNQGWAFSPGKDGNGLAMQACEAWRRIHGSIIATPITTISLPNLNTTLHIKREDLQHTGSFKVRGATNYVMVAAGDGRLHDGAITSSTGNHALGSLHAWNGHVGGAADAPPLQIYVPATTVGVKLDKLRKGGADVVIHGSDCIQAETAARNAAAAQNIPYISPYNNPLVAAGQGTVGLELLSTLPPTHMKTVFVPVGGGGLIAGIAAVLKAAAAAGGGHVSSGAAATNDAGVCTTAGAAGACVRVVGCQPAASDVMRRSVECGYIVEEATEGAVTLSDGTAGGVEQDTCTLQPCMDHVDEWVTVTEAEIAAAVLELHTLHNIPCEGAAAMTYACVRKYIAQRPEVGAAGGLVMVCCGGNTSEGLVEEAHAVLRGGAV